MSKGFFLYHGDKTTCGGRILDGAADDTYLGKRKVREFDPVSCGKHTGTFFVCSGMGDTYNVNGVFRQWAGSLESFSSCPCQARFIPTMLTDSYDDNSNAGREAKRAKEAGKKSPLSDEPEQHAAATKKIRPENRYTVTIYAAYPGTPLNDDEGEALLKDNGERETSTAGHMWIRISEVDEGGKIIEGKSYGFSPIKQSVIIGPGHVTIHDNEHYENPYYSRTIEIKKEHYKKIKEFGDTAENKSNKFFDLSYHGTTNSCIDFTFQSLRFAGLIPSSTWNDLSEYNKIMKDTGKFDGDLKVINNIPHVKSIPQPFPDSELNMEHYNEKPDRGFLQWLLSNTNNSDDESVVDIAKR